MNVVNKKQSKQEIENTLKVSDMAIKVLYIKKRRKKITITVLW